jgi:hypothetical protein
MQVTNQKPNQDSIAQLVGAHLDRVAGLYLQGCDSAGGKFQHALDFKFNGSDAKWDQLRPEVGDAAVFVQADDVDGEEHPQSVNAGGGLNPKPSSGADFATAQQTNEPGQRRVCNFNAVSDGVSPGCIHYGDAMHGYDPSRSELRSPWH